MNILFITLLSSTLLASSTRGLDEARESIRALIRPLLPLSKEKKTNSKFRIDGCKKHDIKWVEILTMREEVTLKYTFAPGCDIQGEIKPQVFRPFTSLLKVRNLASYKEAQSQNKVTASLESKPIVFIELREGLLSGTQGSVKFEADYQIRINPMNSKNPMDENLGGEIRIFEIHGKKTQIKEKIKIQ